MNIVEQYEEGNAWLFRSFGEDEALIREILAVWVYGKVLEIGCGSGRDSAHLMKRCQHLTVTDVIPEMVENTVKTVHPHDSRVCDVHNLPFDADTFDCVFHFGALNTFRNQSRAIAEINRVVKPGGLVIMGDEGIAPWLSETEYARMLIRANPLYLNQPPLHLLPLWARDVRLRWLLGNAFYLIEYRKGDVPTVNGNFQIPGPRGGTLISRFYGT